MSCIHVELAEGSMRGGTTSVSLHYHVTGKLNVCTCFSNSSTLKQLGINKEAPK